MAASSGQAAYEEWCKRINPPTSKLARPLPVLLWGELKPWVKATWEAVAQAAIKHRDLEKAR